MVKNSATAKKLNSQPRRSRKKKLSTEQVKALFDDELHQRYWSESELVLLLPKLIKRVTSYELTTAVEEHLAISEQQIIRLIHVFDSIEERAGGQRSEMMTQLIAEADKIIDATDFGYSTDSAIIDICQRIMKHEIESYGSLREQAIMLGEITAAEYISEAINQEEAAHSNLAQIALSAIYFNQAV